MLFFATEYFKTAAPMPNINTSGLVLPPPRQKVLSNMVGQPAPAGGTLRTPNIRPQFAAEPSAGMLNPGISRPLAKVAEFWALEYFKLAQSAPLLGAQLPGSRTPVASGMPSPKPAADATTRIIRKPAMAAAAGAKTAEFSASAYFASLG